MGSKAKTARKRAEGVLDAWQDTEVHDRLEDALGAAHDAWDDSPASDAAAKAVDRAVELVNKAATVISDAELDAKAISAAKSARKSAAKAWDDADVPKRTKQLASKAEDVWSDVRSSDAADAVEAGLAEARAHAKDLRTQAIKEAGKAQKLARKQTKKALKSDAAKATKAAGKDARKQYGEAVKAARKQYAAASKSDAAKAARKQLDEARKSDTAKAARKQIKKAQKSDAAKAARAATDASLATVGGWLASSPAADKLGVAPKRRVPAWLWFFIGALAGYAVGTLLAPKRGADLRDDLVTSAERLASGAPLHGGLADAIRARLGADARTREATTLSINVADGTVFVRGALPAGVEASAVEEVIAGVPGVNDIDLHVTPAAAPADEVPAPPAS